METSNQRMTKIDSLIGNWYSKDSLRRLRFTILEENTNNGKGYFRLKGFKMTPTCHIEEPLNLLFIWMNRHLLVYFEGRYYDVYFIENMKSIGFFYQYPSNKILNRYLEIKFRKLN